MKRRRLPNFEWDDFALAASLVLLVIVIWQVFYA